MYHSYCVVTLAEEQDAQQREQRQDLWLVDHIDEIERHAQFKLIKKYRFSRGTDLEEMTSRAILEAIIKVRAKAFVPVAEGGWGNDPVVILKQVKARINGFLIDEVKAYLKLSSGRGVTDIYDRSERVGPAEDEEGNSCDIWEAYDNSGQDFFNSYAPSPEEQLMHREAMGIIEGVAFSQGEVGEVLFDVIMGELTLQGASTLLDIPVSTLGRKKLALIEDIRIALREGGY